jgi:anti-sigma regulatory factor (Ser/Thr protein kinase)
MQMPEVDGLELVRQMKARFSHVPVVLMTAHGSEEIAVEALRSGAASYVPKRNLNRVLRDTLQVVLDSVESRRGRQQLLQYMTSTKSRFTLDHNRAGPRALVSYCQDALKMMGVCSETMTLQVGTALLEALVNAIDHGNLELCSELREADDGSYETLRERRIGESPYGDRLVEVETYVSRDEARYVIRDEGAGFDPTSLPDPLDPENLLKSSGRGVLLMRAFMDEVTYNDRGNEVTLIKRRCAD